MNKEYLIWITDMEQANFYMMKGAVAKGISKYKDDCIAIAFTKEDTKKLYKKWCIKTGKLTAKDKKEENTVEDCKAL